MVQSIVNMVKFVQYLKSIESFMLVNCGELELYLQDCFDVKTAYQAILLLESNTDYIKIPKQLHVQN